MTRPSQSTSRHRIPSGSEHNTSSPSLIQSLQTNPSLPPPPHLPSSNPSLPPPSTRSFSSKSNLNLNLSLDGLQTLDSRLERGEQLSHTAVIPLSSRSSSSPPSPLPTSSVDDDELRLFQALD